MSYKWLRNATTFQTVYFNSEIVLNGLLCRLRYIKFSLDTHFFMLIENFMPKKETTSPGRNEMNGKIMGLTPMLE